MKWLLALIPMFAWGAEVGIEITSDARAKVEVTLDINDLVTLVDGKIVGGSWNAFIKGDLHRSSFIWHPKLNDTHRLVKVKLRSDPGVLQYCARVEATFTTSYIDPFTKRATQYTLTDSACRTITFYSAAIDFFKSLYSCSSATSNETVFHWN